MADEIVPFDSPEAASIQTVTGWVSRNGKFYVDGVIQAYKPELEGYGRLEDMGIKFKEVRNEADEEIIDESE